MTNCFVNHKAHERSIKYPRSITLLHKQTSHYHRWLESFTESPSNAAEKFESIIKVSGIRNAPFPNDKITISLCSFLSVLENGGRNDYALYANHPYRVNCEVLCLEGPGATNRGKAVIITAEVVSRKGQELLFDLPEKFKKAKDLNVQIELPPMHSILRILFDPRKTVDQFEGLLLSFTKRDFVKRCVKENHLYCPQKYEAMLQEVQNSEFKIGKIPEDKIQFDIFKHV